MYVYIIHCNTWYYWFRQTSKDDATNTAGDTTKAVNHKTKEETLSSHIYDDINQVPVKHYKSANDKSEKLNDEVTFDITDAHTQPPAYQTVTISTCDSSNFSTTKPNDYYIEDEEMDFIIKRK